MTTTAAPPDNTLAQIAEIQALSIRQLHERWPILMDCPPPGSAESMRQRLIHRVQEIAHGGLRRQTRERLAAIARGEPGGGRDKPPVAGTVFRREWRGQTYEVKAVDGGYEFDGRKYRSLTAVAKAVTGQHWSGNLFFGLVKRKGGSGK